MCISLPGTVVEVNGPLALVDTAGVERWCNALAYPELQIGDRVLLHAAIVVEIITEEQARAAEEAFAELGVLAEPATTETEAGVDDQQVPGAVEA